MPTRNRDLIKTLPFAVPRFGVAFTFAYALTESPRVGASIRFNPG